MWLLIYYFYEINIRVEIRRKCVGIGIIKVKNKDKLVLSSRLPLSQKAKRLALDRKVPEKTLLQLLGRRGKRKIAFPTTQ